MNYVPKTPIKERTMGKWQGILTALGVDSRLLTGKNVTCPICGKKDKFRWTNYQDVGSWICVCGHGDGISLLETLKGWDFKQAVNEIEAVIGDVSHDTLKKPNKDECLKNIKKVWDMGSVISNGSPPDLYFKNRGIILKEYPKCFRFIDDFEYPNGGSYPALISAIQSPEGKCVNVQRLWLTHDGRKAPVETPRMIMAGTVPKGSAIRLFPANEVMGVAEGVETALKAHLRFSVHVWAMYSAENLKGFRAPLECRELNVFGDNDASFTGQAAAYHLAREAYIAAKIAKRDLKIIVKIPDRVETDWAD